MLKQILMTYLESTDNIVYLVAKIKICRTYHHDYFVADGSNIMYVIVFPLVEIEWLQQAMMMTR